MSAARNGLSSTADTVDTGATKIGDGVKGTGNKAADEFAVPPEDPNGTAAATAGDVTGEAGKATDKATDTAGAAADDATKATDDVTNGASKGLPKTGTGLGKTPTGLPKTNTGLPKTTSGLPNTPDGRLRTSAGPPSVSTKAPNYAAAAGFQKGNRMSMLLPYFVCLLSPTLGLYIEEGCNEYVALTPVLGLFSFGIVSFFFAIVRIYRHQSKVALGQIRPMPATGGAGKAGSAGPSRAGTSAGGLGPDSAGDPLSAPTAGATGAAAGRKPSLKNPDAPTSASAAASRKASLANPDAPLADAAGAADETADPGNALRAGSRKPTAKI